MATTACFHCGEPVPPGLDLQVVIDGTPEPMCCRGCQAVASLIAGAGLDNFYQFRTEPAGRPEETVEAGSARYAGYDEPEVQAEFVYQADDGGCEASLVVDGLYCSACGWLIERSLGDADGVDSVQVNPATGRALLRWRPDRIRLSQMMQHMQRLGYRPHPVLPGDTDEAPARERARAMRRLIVAALGMMQAMMFATALYFGDHYGMEPEHEQFLRLVSLLVATPVILYAGLPIFLGAIRDLRNLRPGMDVPVALAIGSGYAASAWVTFAGGAHVYFESVSMFTFFLLLARYVEMTARLRASATSDAMSRLVPSTALRLEADGSTREVPSRSLRKDDRVVVRHGGTIPADGRILEGSAQLDESMLTGESRPVQRSPGEEVVGGCINLGETLVVAIERVGQETVAAHIGRLLERAQAQRPQLARAADRVARHFISVVLVAIAVVFGIWWQVDPAQAFPVTLAMLVATCPCALSLATPTALTAGTNRLAGIGLLVTRADAVETLSRVTHVVFDKTGTLTDCQPDNIDVHLHGEIGRDQAIALALALEAHSDHPIAAALRRMTPETMTESATRVTTVRGLGVEGVVAERSLRLGRPDWALASGADPRRSGGTLAGLEQGGWITLADGDGPIASFRLGHTLRPGARAAVQALQAQGIETTIASGDAPEAVAGVAGELGIRHFQARLSPEDKLATIEHLQDQGHVVLMVGDGINDAPVLAAADVSAAVQGSTALAQASASILLLGGRLGGLSEGLLAARQTRRIIRQNLILSAGYNASILPLAALGWIPPWLAAIGMTCSSLVVVLNASRLQRKPTGTGNASDAVADARGKTLATGSGGAIA